MKKRIALSAVLAMAGGLLAAAPAGAATAVTLSQTALRAGVANTVTVTLDSGATAAEVAAGAVVALRVDTAPTGAAVAAGTVVNSAVVALASTAQSVALAANSFNAAGNYAVTYWYDTNANGLLNIGEPYAAGTIVLGGVPATVSLSSGSTTAVVGTTVAAFTTSATDSAGRATALAATEVLNIVSSTTGAGTFSISTTQAAFGSFSVNPTLAAHAGSYTITVSPGGTLPGTIASTTHALTVLAAAAQVPTDFAMVTTSNVVAGGVAGARTATVNTTVSSLSIKATGATASAPVVLTFTNGGGVAPSGLSLNGSAISVGNAYYVGDANASGEVTFTVATTDTTLNGDTFAVHNGAAGAANKSIAVAFAIAVPDDSESDANIVVAPGASTNLTVTVADQYGNVQSGYVVSAQTVVTTSGTNGPAVGVLGTLVTATTDANGLATLTVAAPVGTVSGTVANVRYGVTNATGATVLALIANTIAYQVSYVTDAAVTTVALSALDFAATADAVGAGTTVTVPFDGVPSGAAGANTGAAVGDDMVKFEVASNPATYITVSGDAGLKFASVAPTTWNGGASSVTVASGSAVYVWATKPGTYAVTASAGGKTATGYFKVNAGGTASARNVAISVDKPSLDPGAFGVATVTVTDAFGNAVATGANELTITASGQVLLQGSAVSATGSAAADGTFKVSYIGAGTAGSGSLVVSATQAATNQFKAAAGYAQGSATVTAAGGSGAGVLGADLSASTASVTSTIAVAAAAKSAAELAAEEAEAEAAKATAEATAATAAAKAAETEAAKATAEAAAATAAAKAAETAAKAAGDAAVAEAAKATAAAEAAKTAAVAEAAKATAEAAKATLAAESAKTALSTLATQVTTLQTTVGSLVASLTSSITRLNSALAKIAKKMGVKL